MNAIITAAGKNSRMINDFEKRNETPIHKLKLEINEKPILIHTLNNVLNSNIDNVIIALGHHKDEIYSLLEEYDFLDKVQIKVNPDVNVGLSKTIENCLNENFENDYLFMAADQPTISTNTINNLISTLKNSENPRNTISVLARRKIGKLDSAEGLGMPFCCYGKLLYNYVKYENDNLNPILRKMISDNVDFYGISSENELELMNINHYDEYIYIKNELEK
ncbi:nucleotidyltransferase family protein [Methanosphaera sp.]